MGWGWTLQYYGGDNGCLDVFPAMGGVWWGYDGDEISKRVRNME